MIKSEKTVLLIAKWKCATSWTTDQIDIVLRIYFILYVGIQEIKKLKNHLYSNII